MGRILVTGGCGFIGHHFVEHLLKNTNWEIIILDRFNASNGLDRLHDIKPFDASRVKVFTADFTQPIKKELEKDIGQVDYIVHMGAETDFSIQDPRPFIMSNVVGTMEILEFARTQQNLKKFIYFSTDEVFGPAPSGTAYKEWDRYNSTNPYSASKAGGEELCLAWAYSYKLPIVIIHTMNVFGERQNPAKLIPKCIKKILSGEMMQIHGSTDKKISGSRFWIHARNLSNGILFLLEKGEVREKYNIVGEKEVSNIEMAQTIAKVLNKPLKYEMVNFHSGRPGHDLRYALDGTKMMELGWKLPMSFEESVKRTVQWTLEHPKWLG